MNIFLDGPDIKNLKKFKKKVNGFTYNPSLISKFCKKNYLSYCKKLQKLSYPLPISLEVIADDKKNMITQGLKLSQLGNNVVVKIPITFTNGKSTIGVIKELSDMNVNLNITAIFNVKQVVPILKIIKKTTTILSVFAGRIHDMGKDASIEIVKIKKLLKKTNSNCRILWASTRQIYDLVLAKKCGCSIITMDKNIFLKKSNFKKNWRSYSLETVKGFLLDSKKSKFTI